MKQWAANYFSRYVCFHQKEEYKPKISPKKLSKIVFYFWAKIRFPFSYFFLSLSFFRRRHFSFCSAISRIYFSFLLRTKHIVSFNIWDFILLLRFHRARCCLHIHTTECCNNGSQTLVFLCFFFSPRIEIENWRKNASSRSLIEQRQLALKCLRRKTMTIIVRKSGLASQLNNITTRDRGKEIERERKKGKGKRKERGRKKRERRESEKEERERERDDDSGT